MTWVEHAGATFGFILLCERIGTILGGLYERYRDRSVRRSRHTDLKPMVRQGPIFVAPEVSDA